MTHDYTEIDDDEILPDSPGTSILFFRLRDNPEAIAEGAPDAPRIAIGALERLAVGDVQRGETETGAVSYGPGGGSSGTQRFVVFMFLQAGNVRLVVNRSGISGSCSLIRRRNKADTTILSPSGSGDSSPVDVAVLPGDALVLSMLISSGEGSGSLTAYVKIFTDGSTDLWPGLPASIIGNTYNA